MAGKQKRACIIYDEKMSNFICEEILIWDQTLTNQATNYSAFASVKTPPYRRQGKKKAKENVETLFKWKVSVECPRTYYHCYII